jgi:Chaperone of endosialidase
VEAAYGHGSIAASDGSGNGVFTGGCFATAYPGPSDTRLKDDIQEFHAGLDELLQVKPSSWAYTGKLNDGLRHVGIHAQHLANVIPEAVVELPTHDEAEHTVENPLGVDPAPVLAAVVNALYEIDARLKKLEVGVVSQFEI